MKFSDAIIQRYACKSFQSDSSVKESDLKEILALTQRAPTCFNSQPWVAVVVRRDDESEDDASSQQNAKLVKTAFATNQQRIRDAGATVVFCADLEPMRNLDQLVELSAQQGYGGDEAKKRMKMALTAVAYHVKPINWILNSLKAVLLPIVGLFTPVMTAMYGESTRTWAIKQTMFAASTFCLASTGYGYQTCLMEGFDSNRARKVIGLSSRYVPTVMVSIGTSDKEPKSLAPRFQPDQVYFDGHASKPFHGIEPATILLNEEEDKSKANLN